MGFSSKNQIKVALNDMTAKGALKFIQSFALTPLSCSRLLEFLDADETPLLGEVLEDAKRAAQYVRPYKLMGAKGGDKVCT